MQKEAGQNKIHVYDDASPTTFVIIFYRKVLNLSLDNMTISTYLAHLRHNIYITPIYTVKQQ